MSSIRRLSLLLLPLVFLAACQVNPVDEPYPGPIASVSSSSALPRRRLPPAQSVPTVVAERAAYPDLWTRIREDLTLYQNYHHKSIDEELSWYLNNPGYFTRITERAAPFLFEIVSEVQARDLPLELALLPMVESAFDPTAYSTGHAAGLWQFIGPTARTFGLHSDWWYDGRRDPIASTRAALDYLEYLHQEFNGNWLLALAAYNAGEGTVKRALRRSGQKTATADFWQLRLPSETRGHVPRLLAAARLIADAEQYELTLASIPDEPYLEMVDLDFQIDLSAAAQMAAIDIELLRTLNAGYLQWATHPEYPQTLVLPRDQAETFRQALDDMATEDRPAWDHYRIKRGDTLSGIARQFNTRVSLLQSINNLKGSRIVAGDTLLIPTPGAGTAAVVASNAKRGDNGINPPIPTSYQVRAGDSLWRIAKQFDLKSGDIAAWNDLHLDAILQPGQILALQPRELLASTASTGTLAQNRVRYTISKGDTLFSIARKFRVSVAELTAWNDLDTASVIFPGQDIEIFVSNASLN